MEEFNNKKPPTPLLISFDAEEVRKQAAASTLRFEEGIAIFSTYKCLYVHTVNGSCHLVLVWFMMVHIMCISTLS